MYATVRRQDGPASVSKSMMLPRFVALVAIVASALSGCGGDGSSGNSGSTGTGGTSVASAKMVVSPLQVNVTAATTEPAPTAIIQVAVQVSTTAGTQTQY